MDRTNSQGLRQKKMEWIGLHVEAYQHLSDDDKVALEEWERENNGDVASTDWPGWRAVLPTFEEYLAGGDDPESGLVVAITTCSSLPPVGFFTGYFI